MQPKCSGLPGFPHRDDFMRAHNKSPLTGRRWQAEGRIVVRYLGREPLVDLEATAARLRAEGRGRSCDPACSENFPKKITEKTG